jgi:hypothetical protein
MYVHRLGVKRCEKPRNCRIVFVSLPIATCLLKVTREVSEQISQADRLMLDTIRHLQDRPDQLTSEVIASFTGIQEGVVRGQLARLVMQNILSKEGTRISLIASVRTEGDRVVCQKTEIEPVTVLGNPPTPLLGNEINEEVLQDLKCFEPLSKELPGRLILNPDLLERWRQKHWGELTVSLSCHGEEKLRLGYYVVSGEIRQEGVHLRLYDAERPVPLDLPADHPWLASVLEQVIMVEDTCPAKLDEYGKWDCDASRLVCDSDDWIKWSELGGGIHSVVRLQDISTGLTIETPVTVLPAGKASAGLMVREALLNELWHEEGPVDHSVVTRCCQSLKKEPPWDGIAFDTPSLEELQSLAWERDWWPLAYRLAAKEDGLWPSA